MSDLLIALGLVLAVEGTLYALFPGAMQTMMRRALELPAEQLRFGGLFALVAGVVIVWLVRG